MVAAVGKNLTASSVPSSDAPNSAQDRYIRIYDS
jgi:hypothetical protein